MTRYIINKNIPGEYLDYNRGQIKFNPGHTEKRGKSKMKTQKKYKGLTLGKLAEVLNKHFCPPFVEKGFVNAALSPDGELLSIIIGRRDIEIDRNGDVVGAGTKIAVKREGRKDIGYEI